jgi:hypothetical protein
LTKATDEGLFVLLDIEGNEVMIDSEVKPAIAPGLLRPYISLMFLETTSNREQHAFTELTAFMKGVRLFDRCEYFLISG